MDAQAPIGKGNYDSSGENATVTIDGMTSWTVGTATTNFNWTISTTSDGDNTTDDTNNTWTLTPKSSN